MSCHIDGLSVAAQAAAAVAVSGYKLQVKGLRGCQATGYWQGTYNGVKADRYEMICTPHNSVRAAVLPWQNRSVQPRSVWSDKSDYNF